MAQASMVPKRLRALLIFGALVSTGALAADRDGATTEIWNAAPFFGKVVATVQRPGGMRPERPQTGTASARFIDAGAGRLRLVVVGNVRTPSDTGFTVEGMTSESGWQGQAAGWNLSISKDGTIAGGGVEAQHRLRFAGRASAERINLHVETELLQANARGLPAGSVIAFDYTLRRSSPPQAAGSGTTTPAPATMAKKTCRRTIWQMRNVTTPLGGMQMIRVPVCAD